MSTEVCSICLDNEAKYTCPACESKTCSLECVKRHKLRTECTGIVDPTKFIPNNDLGSKGTAINRDYNYLLNFERKINVGKTDLKESAKQVFKRNFNQDRHNKRPRHNETIQEDSRMALVRSIFPNVSATSVKRENTLIIHLPPGMSRSSQNKSGYDKKSSSFTWTVEWTPLKEDNTAHPSFLSFRLKESTVLKEAVPLSILAKSFGKETLEKNNLHFYIENCVSSRARKLSLIPLNADDTLTSALKDKIVLEFPQIYVSLSPVTDTEILSPDGYGIGDTSSENEDTSSSSDTDSEDSSDSDSTTASTDSSDSDSDDAPEEESSKAPEPAIDVSSENGRSLPDA